MHHEGKQHLAILLHVGGVRVLLDDGTEEEHIPNREVWSVGPRCQLFF